MNTVHPSAIVEEGVVLGRDNVIGPYSVLYAGTVLGDGNWIGSHCVIGTAPEHRGFHGNPTEGIGRGVTVGSRTILHEFVSIQTGTESTTKIMDDVMLMTQSSVGHDAVLGAGSTIGSGSNIAGHVVLEEKVTIGLGVLVVQRAFIGRVAMVAMGSVVDKDVAPFAFVAGTPCRQIGLNEVGIARNALQGPWQEHYWELLDGRDGDSCDGTPAFVHQGFAAWLARAETRA